MYAPGTENGRAARRFFGAAGKKITKAYKFLQESLIPPYRRPACKATNQCHFFPKTNHRILT